MCKICDAVYTVNNQNTLKRMEQKFQDVAQKVQCDENLDSFTAHFVQHFTKKPSPLQCYKIMTFDIILYSKLYWSDESLGLIVRYAVHERNIQNYQLFAVYL